MPTPPDRPGDSGSDATLAGPLASVDSRHPPLLPPGHEPDFPRTLMPEPHDAARYPRTWVTGGPAVALSLQDGPAAYELIRELGRGAMGVVFLARHRQLDRLVALKMIVSGSYADAEDLARFQTEALAIARVAHPGIVAIYEVGEHNGLPYFAMEYCAGGSLASHLDGSPLHPEQAARLLQPVVRAMQHAHEQGVIHRDLKPGNVLLQVSDNGSSGTFPTIKAGAEAPAAPPDRTASGAFSLREGKARPQPKVADFGLARLMEGGTQTRSGDILGTPSYMAPEQAAGQVRDIGPHTDVWAMGAILYEMLTGRAPFVGISPMETLQFVIFREPVAVRALQPKVPRDLETICHKCLQKDPSRRYPSTSALADDLERYLDGRPILARPIGPVERVLRWARRRPGMAALAGLLVLSLLGGVGGVTAAMLYAFAGWEKADQNARAESERAEEARQNFAKALSAVDRYFTEVSENTLLNQPGMQPVREKMLRDARDYYRQFLQERGGDPMLQRELLRSQYRLGLIEAELGRLAEAVKLFDDALARLGNVPSPDRELRRDEALLLHHRGRTLRDLDRVDEATNSYNLALAIWAELRKADPASLLDKDGEAASLLGRGNIDFKRGRYDDARLRYRASLALRQELVKARPEEEAYRRDLATSWQNVAAASAQAGDRGEADRADAEARKVLEALVARYPGRASYQDGLGMSWYNRANQQLARGDLAGAMKSYLAAVGQFTALSLAHPAVPRYRDRLAQTYWNLGAAYEQGGLPAHAGAAYQQEHLLNEELAKTYPLVPAFQGALAKSLWKQGDLALARGKADEARKSYDRAAGLLAELAKKPLSFSPYRGLQAEVTHQLGVIDLRGGKFAEAARSFSQALAVLEDGGKPVSGADIELVGRCYNNLGLAAVGAGQADKALAWYDRAATTAGKLELDKALAGLANGMARDAASGKALALDALSRYEDAVKCWDEALKREAKAGLALMQARRLGSLARTPRYDEAARAAEEAGKKATVAAVLFELARVPARAAKTAAADGAIEADERDRRAQAHLAAALDLLKRANEKGAFATAEGRQRLAGEPDLAALRSRKEVKEWLREKPEKKGG